MPTNEKERTLVQIEKVVQKKVRPLLAQHGGDMQVLGFENGLVRFKFLGPCASCQGADESASSIVKKHIMLHVPQVKDVVQVNEVNHQLWQAAIAILKNSKEKAMNIKKVCVIGAGQMGRGIAQVMASAGLTTCMYDISQEYVDNGMAFIEAVLDKDVKKEKITLEKKQEIIAKLKPTTVLNDVADCDLVVEAIVEDMEVKGKMFSQLDAICKPSCILASNTSSKPITEIAAFTKRPQQVVGMHFMNPVPVMKLVEIIRGLATNDETCKAVSDLSVVLGKSPVEVRDVPGFISNRVLQVMINEAIYCLYEGVASPQDIDQVMKLGMNHPMGPLQLADFIGLDTVLAIMETLYDGYADCKYRPCPLLRQYVKAGWLGKKVGRGFYTY